MDSSNLLVYLYSTYFGLKMVMYPLVVFCLLFFFGTRLNLRNICSPRFMIASYAALKRSSLSLRVAQTTAPHPREHRPAASYFILLVLLIVTVQCGQYMVIWV